VTPEEESSDIREMVWEMSRMTNRVLIFGIFIILAISNLEVRMRDLYAHLSFLTLMHYADRY